jgi:hypothetical protein
MIIFPLFQFQGIHEHLATSAGASFLYFSFELMSFI